VCHIYHGPGILRNCSVSHESRLRLQALPSVKLQPSRMYKHIRNNATCRYVNVIHVLCSLEKLAFVIIIHFSSN
jgi:hypothetical protein